MNPRRLSRDLFLLVLLIPVAGMARLAVAGDWPTYMRDNQRSGVTPMRLDLPLSLQWTHIPEQPPNPAWPDPARQDFWHRVRELSPVVVYDRAYHVVSVGDAVYYASSATDQVYCLDAATGKIRWRFIAEGPVRLAPSVADGHVYFSSDDGRAYCVRADTGALVWNYAPATQDRRLPGNGRIIAHAPARTGVLVDNGAAYFFAGLFPPEHVYACALDAETGTVVYRGVAEGVSPQGYLLASATRLFVPTGRTSPVMFDRDSMENLGALQSPGGAYALLVEDAVVSGPGIREVDRLHYTPQETRERIASLPARRMLVHEGMAYLQGPEHVSALDRERYIALAEEIKQRDAVINAKNQALRELDPAEDATAARLGTEIAELMLEVAQREAEQEACYRWKRPLDAPYAMILAADVLFLGGQDRIWALSASDGDVLWQHALEGRIYGLAAANGRLYASSSTGAIYCFAADAVATPAVVKPEENEHPFNSERPDHSPARAAREILDASGITKGYCLVLGAGDGQLAYELARQSDLRVVGVERDAARAAAARAALADTGLYGARLVIHHVAGPTLPYTGYLANLVVAKEPDAWEAEEIHRVVRPYGGQVFVQQTDGADAGGPGPDNAADAVVRRVDNWILVERGAVPGAGAWTQLYADASHTAYSGDQLQGPVTVQWFGEPGPRDMVDRHHRPMSSLFQDGRLFITGNNKVITVDGYNGFPLWELDVPDSRRIGVMKSSGHQVLAGEHLYIVRLDECWAVHTKTGVKDAVIKAPVPDDAPRHWGYLNQADTLLIGSLQSPEANFEQMSRAMVHMLEGDHRPVIMSESLFAVDRRTGAVQWRHTGGRILNAMITVAEDRVYFVESRNDTVMANTNGRIRIAEFMEDEVFLTALDVYTGDVVWVRPLTLPFEHIAYLCGRDGILIASGSYNRDGRLYYDLAAFHMADGGDKWLTTLSGMNIRGTDYTYLDATHGEQWQHPVLTEDAIYLRPYAFCLQTGEQLDYIVYRGGHGCGGLAGSAHYLFGRGHVPRMYPRAESGADGVPLTEVSRPGCFINIIPAGGMVLAPESSSGCTCAYPLQTSFAFVPAAVAGGVTR